MTTIHRCMIVEASQRDFAAWLCEQLAPISGGGMFKRGLSPTGENPPTHFISVGLVGAEFDGALSSPDTLYKVCEATGVSVTVVRCTDLLSASDISDDLPDDALLRLNLKVTPRSPDA
jgi:hypothetical protein